MIMLDASSAKLESNCGFLRSVLFNKDGSTVSWELPKLLLRGKQQPYFQMQLHLHAAHKHMSCTALVCSVWKVFRWELGKSDSSEKCPSWSTTSPLLS